MFLYSLVGRTLSVHHRDASPHSSPTFRLLNAIPDLRNIGDPVPKTPHLAKTKIPPLPHRLNTRTRTITMDAPPWRIRVLLDDRISDIEPRDDRKPGHRPEMFPALDSVVDIEWGDGVPWFIGL